MSASKFQTRRAVSGVAFRDCDFCGRNHQGKDSKSPFNYQYLDENTGDWDKRIFCSKTCRNAWRTMNND